MSTVERDRETAGTETPLYDPPNLPPHIQAGKNASLTDQEQQLLERDT
jgi:hypothetical protein